MEEMSKRRDIDASIRWLSNVAPVPASEAVQATIAKAIEQHGHRYTHMFSGAGHDAAHMAQIAPMGMIFVPSHEGRSHTPEEWTDYEQIAVGARMLAQTLVNIDVLEEVQR
jgi:N-carbamoyl-L-amino-acid hydrolase